MLQLSQKKPNHLDLYWFLLCLQPVVDKYSEDRVASPGFPGLSPTRVEISSSRLQSGRLCFGCLGLRLQPRMVRRQCRDVGSRQLLCLLDSLHPVSLCPPLRDNRPLARQRLILAGGISPQQRPSFSGCRLLVGTSSSPLRAPITPVVSFLDDLHSRGLKVFHPVVKLALGLYPAAPCKPPGYIIAGRRSCGG